MSSLGFMIARHSLLYNWNVTLCHGFSIYWKFLQNSSCVYSFYSYGLKWHCQSLSLRLACFVIEKKFAVTFTAFIFKSDRNIHQCKLEVKYALFLGNLCRVVLQLLSRNLTKIFGTRHSILGWNTIYLLCDFRSSRSFLSTAFIFLILSYLGRFKTNHCLKHT